MNPKTDERAELVLCNCCEQTAAVLNDKDLGAVCCDCKDNLLSAVNYLEFYGLMLGLSGCAEKQPTKKPILLNLRNLRTPQNPNS